MPFFKSPTNNLTSVSLHGKEFDVQNGFIDIDEADLTSEIENTLKSLLGFVLADDDEVGAAVSVIDVNVQAKAELDRRSLLIGKMKAAGIRVDARKGIRWIEERYEEYVADGTLPLDGAEVLNPPLEAKDEPKEPEAVEEPVNVEGEAKVKSDEPEAVEDAKPTE